MRMLLRRIAQLDVPQEVVLGWPRSVLLGDEKLIVERHLGIYACTDTEIVVKTSRGLLHVTGTGLSLGRYGRDDLVVLGKIDHLAYRPRRETR